MGDLAEQIAREHTLTDALGLVCSCGIRPGPTAYSAHIATVTERAVRERVAAEIIRQKVISHDPRYDEFNDALDFATRIAQEESPDDHP